MVEHFCYRGYRGNNFRRRRPSGGRRETISDGEAAVREKKKVIEEGFPNIFSKISKAMIVILRMGDDCKMFSEENDSNDNVNEFWQNFKWRWK